MENSQWFFGSRKILIFIVTLSFLAAMGIRLYDLTDLPLDFSPTRQMLSVVKARGLYYAMSPTNSELPQWQREMAIKQWKAAVTIEPPILETLTASTYLLFGEHIWIARIYSSLFWVAAGLLLFWTAREAAGESGAFVSLLFYLFLPFGAIASRAFQPDPLMVALVVAGVWGTYRWANTRSMKWAIVAGILNGLAIFAKNVAIFPLFFVAIALVLEYGLLKSLKDKQTWVVAFLSALPAGIYTLYGLIGSGFLDQQFAFRFFPQLWPDPAFYLHWLGQIEGVVGFGAFAISLIGIFVANRRASALLIGLWLGYFVYGMTFPYHISTHDYYQLPLIPIVALSLAPIAETIAAQIKQLHNEWFIRGALVLLITLVTAIQLWNVRVYLAHEDWRPDAEFWTALGDKLGHNDKILAIAQDYGSRLAYWGWEDVDSWYDTGDLNLRALDGRQIDLLQRFQQQASGKRFLVITQLNRLEQQPEIKDFIYNTYPVFAEGKGYIVFDLTHPR